MHKQKTYSTEEVENDASARPPNLTSASGVTLSYDLLTPKVDRFILLSSWSLVSICNKMGSSALYKYHVYKFDVFRRNVTSTFDLFDPQSWTFHLFDP